MNLPFFYIAELEAQPSLITLDEDTSKHVVSVLRMGIDAPLLLTDGKGQVLKATIVSDHKKKCVVQVKEVTFTAHDTRKITLAVSLLKNASRFEWLLEKATEMGIYEMIPLICKRTEKQFVRFDRLKNILVSAMLQSQQAWLPVLHEPQPLQKVIETARQQQKFIAHCEEVTRTPLQKAVNAALGSQLILIGPEGDFTPEEIALATGEGFVPVMLGQTRLRTETAGMVAAALLKNA